MTPEALAGLHALAFTEAPRPWSAAEFADLLTLPSTRLVARPPDGFALGQLAGPEATLLTLAVHPDRRRRGLARALLGDLEERMRTEGAEEMFLEVAAGNDAALGLYAAFGYRPVGARALLSPRRAAAGRCAGAAAGPRSVRARHSGKTD